MVAFRQMRFRFSLCDGVLKQHLLKLMETAEWCYLVEYSFHVQESSLWTGYWKSSKCFCKGVYIKVGYASSKMPVEVSQPCQPELESVSCFSFLLQKVLLWDLSHHFSTSRVSSTGAGGTKFNPQLGCWPWASLPQPPMYGHQVPVLPEWKVLGKKPYIPLWMQPKRELILGHGVLLNTKNRSSRNLWLSDNLSWPFWAKWPPA